jgi:hypothetical protein
MKCLFVVNKSCIHCFLYTKLFGSTILHPWISQNMGQVCVHRRLRNGFEHFHAPKLIIHSVTCGFAVC